jgi:enterochelin esterase-like enzyme
VTFNSEALGRDKAFALLHAPDAPGREPRDLPLVVLLHGMGGDHVDLDRHGLSDRLLQGMRAGELPPAHVVAPDGERGFYLDWADGSQAHEEHLLREVLPMAQARLGLARLPRQLRHVAGVSMGGSGALFVGLRHPECFASITCISGLIPDEEQARRLGASLLGRLIGAERIFGRVEDRAFFEAHNPHRIVARRGPELGQRLFLAAGTGDRPYIRRTSERFRRLLEERKIDHRWTLFEGAHGWRSWGPLLERALRFALVG